MSPLIVKLIVSLVAKKALKSATAAVAAGVGAVGVSAAVSPDILELIPEAYRGLAITLVSIAILLARFRKEISAAIAAAKTP